MIKYKIRYGRTFPTKTKYSVMKIELEKDVELKPFDALKDKSDFNRTEFDQLKDEMRELMMYVEAMKVMRNNIFMEESKSSTPLENDSKGVQ